MTDIINSQSYLLTLEGIKKQIVSSQIKAHLAVNKEMLILYWQIGKIILEKQEEEKWGTKITRKLSEDLAKAFPHMKGFSYTNIRYMQRFTESYPDLLFCPQLGGKIEKDQNMQQPIAQLENGKNGYKNNYSTICPQAVGKTEDKIFYSDYSNIILGIPWGHNREILDKIKDKTQRLWYAEKTIENGWSRNVLIHQIQSDLHSRQAQKELKTNNFSLTLPQVDCDLVNEIFKDKYNFEFIDNSKGRLHEREIEKELTDKIIKFLTELGQGFAFVGKQYHMEVAGQDFYMDLVFYHIKLKSYIIIELKAGSFKPEYVGKMGFYLACVDDYLRDDKDNYSIGIILCNDDNSDKEIKEKSLNCMMRPIGVSSYSLTKKEELPKELKPLEDLKRIVT